MVRILSLLAVFLPVVLPVGAAELVDRTVVVINEDVILESEVQHELELFLAAESMQIPVGPEGDAHLAELRELVLEGLVGRKLMDQAIVRLGIAIADSEVDSAIANIASMNNMTLDQLKQQLAREGIALEEFRSDQRDYLLQSRLFQAEIGTQIEITEDMVRQRYRERYGEVEQDHEYHLRVLILHLPARDPGVDAAAVGEKAGWIRDQVAAGVPFEDLAGEHCDDEAIASKNGDFGKVRPAAMIPEFRAAVEGLPLNAVSEPVEFQGALWLLQVYRITDAASSSFDTVRDQLFEELYQEHQEREIEIWLEEERSRAHVEYLH